MENVHLCKRCNVKFNAKHHLLNHLKRKFKCKPIDLDHDLPVDGLIEEMNKKEKCKYTCEKCSKQFTTKQNLKRHNDCNCKNNINAIVNLKNTNIDSIKYDFLKNYVQEIENRLKEVETNSSKILTSIDGSNNNINIQNNILHIQLQNFGNEKTEHLTSQFLDKCLLECNSGVTNLLREIHFNPNIPENHNIRSLSKKQNTLEMFSDGVWHACDKNNTLDKMIRNGYKILFQHFANTHLDNDTEEQQQRNEYINEYLTKIMRKEGNIYYELRRDLYMLILDGNFYILGR